MNKKLWNDPKYQRIINVIVKGGEIQVEFEDKSKVILDRDIILPVDAHNPDWAGLQFNAYEIILPTAQGETEIPWSTIRLLSDASFASYWAQKAEEQAKDIGQRLRVLRQSKNLSSKDVAERAGISPQSLSRIEKGHHDVVFTTLRKILAAMGCTLQDLALVEVVPLSLNSLLTRLESAGIRKEWLLERILPRELMSDFDEKIEKTHLINQIANLVSRIYAWSPEQILGDKPLIISPDFILDIKFKKQARSQINQVNAYALYAHYLSLLVLQTIEHLELRDLPESPDEVRKEILRDYGHVNLENSLRYIWDHGIPVIPLSDPGAFHGACWKISDRKIIVLKQLTKFQGRWLFDLAHELGHLIRNMDNVDSIIEDEEISPLDNEEVEEDANNFASDLLFFGRVDKLADLAAERAKGKVENLKSAAIQIAAEEKVPLDLFANYLAFRLSAANNINWWGAANNLQISEPSAFVIAREVFNEKVNIDVLSEEDQQLLLRALEN